MKLDSKEKLIWEVSKKVQLPPIPNKDIVWERLIQEIEIHQDESEKIKTPLNSVKKVFF